MIERPDPAGRRHVAVIRLCLEVFDRALVRRRNRGVEGFIRFEGLDRERRYAEILGHELVHAVWTLSDRSNERLTEDLDREIREYDSLRSHNAQGGALDEHATQHLSVIQSLVARIEKPAETAEVEVWQELSHWNR